VVEVGEELLVLVVELAPEVRPSDRCRPRRALGFVVLGGRDRRDDVQEHQPAPARPDTPGRTGRDHRDIARRYRVHSVVDPHIAGSFENRHHQIDARCVQRDLLIGFQRGEHHLHLLALEQHLRGERLAELGQLRSSPEHRFHPPPPRHSGFS
jgi:hypothetical protein